MAVERLDIFGTYLNAVRSATPPERPEAGLVELVRRHPGPEPIRYKELWQAAFRGGYSAEQFTAALQKLRAARLLALHTQADPNNPSVELTPDGVRATVLLG